MKEKQDFQGRKQQVAEVIISLYMREFVCNHRFQMRWRKLKNQSGRQENDRSQDPKSDWGMRPFCGSNFDFSTNPKAVHQAICEGLNLQIFEGMGIFPQISNLRKLCEQAKKE